MCAHLWVLPTAPQDHRVEAAGGLNARGRGRPSREAWALLASRITGQPGETGERDLCTGCDRALGERRHVEATRGAWVLTTTCCGTSKGEQQHETSAVDCGKTTGAI